MQIITLTFLPSLDQQYLKIKLQEKTKLLPNYNIILAMVMKNSFLFLKKIYTLFI